MNASKKDILLLTVIATVAVALNLSLLILVELGKTSPVESSIIKVLTGNANANVLKSETLTRGFDLASPKEAAPVSTPVDPYKKMIYYKGKIPMIIDYSKASTNINGVEVPFIIDDIVMPDGTKEKFPISKIQEFAQKSPDAWTHLTYSRFDVYINDSFYNSSSANLTQFFGQFVDRYAELEQQTGWSSEKFYGQKLKIYVEPTAGCWGGYAIPGEAHLLLSDPFYSTGCKLPSFNPDKALEFGNPGELGDYWNYMAGALHESLHSINPLPILVRDWLTEGWSNYYMLNIMSDYGDINQETSDYYIYTGTTNWNWNNYTANDYKDTANKEIQLSSGYDITAWMFSMMRDDYGLNWLEFYSVFDKNDDDILNHWGTNSSLYTNEYHVDSVLIGIFARSSDLGTFEAAKNVWEYDGPSGPGWGVRQWPARTWYADLTTSLASSKSSAGLGESFTVNATVFNSANYQIFNVPVQITANGKTIKTQNVNISAHGNTKVSVIYSSAKAQRVVFETKIDKDDVKLESNENNNYAKTNVSIGCTTYFDKKKWTYVDTCPITPQEYYSGAGVA